MFRTEINGTSGEPARQFLQNDMANYVHEGGSVSINNYRIWSADLSVMRLPTDGRTLTNFLTRIEGKTSPTEPVSSTKKGLLVTVERTGEDALDAQRAQPITVRHGNILDEDYFQSDWPTDARIVDNRDAMHARGWTYLRIRGQVQGHTITGTGRIPFVYGASRQHSPWLKLQIGEGTTLVDTHIGALVLDADGETTARYPQGSFLRGLSRPWMGLHTMDLIRRDAAELRVDFETQVIDNGRDVQVTVLGDRATLVYTIDLEADLVRRIEFRRDNTSVGQLDFDYLQELDGDLTEFQMPTGLNRRVTLEESQGILWLTQLASGAFTH